MKFGLNAHLFHAWWGVGPIGATRPCWLTVGVARWPLSPSLSGVIVQNGASAKSQDAGWNFGATYEGQNCSVHPRQEDSVVSETQTTIMYSDQQNHPWGLTPHLTPHQSSHLNVNTLRMQNYFLPSALQRPQILQPHPSNRTSLLCGRQRSNCRNNTVSLPVNFLFFNNDKWFSCEEHDCSSEQFSSGQFVTGQLDKISTTQ